MRSFLTSLRAASLDDSDACDPEFERLVEEVTAQLQNGEAVDFEKLAEDRPEHAEQIRDLLPAIEMLLRIGGAPVERAATNGAASSSPRQQQLGDFRIIRELGRGGMGVVYEAEQLSLARRVALKVLPFAGMLDQQQLARFKNEARAAATLDHPNIVAVHFVGSERGVHFYAMQLIDGQSLAEYIASMKPGRPPSDAGIAPAAVPTNRPTAGDTAKAALPTLANGGSAAFFRTAARLVIQAAEALDHAHQNGILHRDIKPANLLVDDTGKLWITDFGLARMEADAGMTMTGDLWGTLRYMSPEQALAKRVVVDHRSDIYSLGATLYELITLQPAFGETDRSELLKRIAFHDPRPPRQIDSHIPIELETIVLKAMRKGPEHRYATAQEMADDLRRFLENKPIKAKPISVMERTFRWANRNRGLAASLVGALIVVSVLALVANALILRANSRTAEALAESQDNEDKARQSAAAAEASERKTGELLYAADMALAGAAWKKNEPAQVRMILDRYIQPKTRPDGSQGEDLRGFEWCFLDRQIRPQSELLFQNNKALYLIEFMPDGKEFFTAGQDSIVRWHEAGTGKVLSSLDTQQQEINCVLVQPVW